ncbi:MAG: D-ala-D-ala transporter subunit, partial [Firmicutes bacterium ML8_F2]
MKQSVFIKTMKPKVKHFGESISLLKRNRLTCLSFYAVIMLLLIAVMAPLLLPTAQHIDQATNPTEKLLGPSLEHPFGTDELGRDLFKRVLLGTRISLQTALVAVLCAIMIGVPLGAVAGFFGGAIDEIIMRITDIFLGFPPLLLAMSIAAFMGPSLRNATLAIAVAWWPWFTRIVRGQAVSLRERQFVRAAIAIGTPSHKIVYKHIIPNCLAPIIVQSTMD